MSPVDIGDSAVLPGGLRPPGPLREGPPPAWRSRDAATDGQVSRHPAPCWGKCGSGGEREWSRDGRDALGSSTESNTVRKGRRWPRFLLRFALASTPEEEAGSAPPHIRNLKVFSGRSLGPGLRFGSVRFGSTPGFSKRWREEKRKSFNIPEKKREISEE